MKWTNGKKEQLFVIAKMHDKKLVALEKVNESSEVIHSIAERLDEEPRAVLFMLAKMGFFKANNRTSYRDGVFYKRDAKVSTEQFTIHPQFEKLSTERATHLELALTELVKISSPMEECLFLLSKQFEISELNVEYELPSVDHDPLNKGPREKIKDTQPNPQHYFLRESPRYLNKI